MREITQEDIEIGDAISYQVNPAIGHGGADIIGFTPSGNPLVSRDEQVIEVNTEQIYIVFKQNGDIIYKEDY